jgi:hypothetical protein
MANHCAKCPANKSSGADPAYSMLDGDNNKAAPAYPGESADDIECTGQAASAEVSGQRKFHVLAKRLGT